MTHRIVTISREFGSGGRTVGRLLAERLHIPCYDNELIGKIAQESGFAEQYVQHMDETSTLFSSRAFGPTNEDLLWDSQRRVILALAEQGPCVIVGRCADYILRDRADCLTAFIHASPDFRAERIVREYGERAESPTQRIREKDKQRAAYHRFYTDMKWGHAQNYHISLDSGALGVERCVELLQQLY